MLSLLDGDHLHHHESNITERHLSTASVSWALASLALNVATQDCDRVLFVERQYSPLLRAAPVGCAFDTIQLLAQLYAGKVSSGSFQTALNTPADLQRATQPGTRSKPRLSIDLIIGVAAISQLVKLMSARGLPLVQAVAILYMFAYGLQILVTYGSRPVPDKTSSPKDHDRKVEEMSGLAVFLVYFMAQLYHSAASQTMAVIGLLNIEHSSTDENYGFYFWTKLIGLAVGLSTVFTFVAAVPSTDALYGQKIQWWLRAEGSCVPVTATAILAISIAVGFVVAGIPHLFGRDQEFHLFCYMLDTSSAFTWLSLALVGPTMLMYKAPWGPTPYLNTFWGHSNSHFTHGLLTAHLMLALLHNFGLVVMYLMFYYQPEATTRPAWTDYLG